MNRVGWTDWGFYSSCTHLGLESQPPLTAPGLEFVRRHIECPLCEREMCERYVSSGSTRDYQPLDLSDLNQSFVPMRPIT